MTDRVACGVVGIGNIGLPMALTLVRAGLNVTVYDVRPDAVEEAVAAGTRGAPCLRSLAESCEIVSVIVVDDAQVENVMLSENGLLAHLRPGSAVVIQSAIRPGTVVRLGELCGKRDIVLIDAPISGGAERAGKGELQVMVGGTDKAIDRCLPLLEPLGKVWRVGALGNGMVIKMATTLMYAAARAYTYEALKLTAAYGIDESLAREIALVGSGDSWALRELPRTDQVLLHHTLAGTPERMFEMFSKEQWNCAQTAREQGLHLPLTGLLAGILPTMYKERIELLRARERGEPG